MHLFSRKVIWRQWIPLTGNSTQRLFHSSANANHENRAAFHTRLPVRLHRARRVYKISWIYAKSSALVGRVWCSSRWTMQISHTKREVKTWNESEMTVGEIRRWKRLKVKRFMWGRKGKRGSEGVWGSELHDCFQTFSFLISCAALHWTASSCSIFKSRLLLLLHSRIHDNFDAAKLNGVCRWKHTIWQPLFPRVHNYILWWQFVYKKI